MASHVAKSLVFLAVSAALSGAAIASPSGSGTLNLTEYKNGGVLQNFDQTYEAGKKSDEETIAKEAEGIVGILVGTTSSNATPSASAENFTARLTLNRKNVPASAYTLLVNRAPTTFTGSSTKISMTAVDGTAQGDQDPDDAGSALLVQGDRIGFDGTYRAADTTLVSFGADSTTLETTMKGAKAGSTNTVHLEGNSALAFTGKTVKISANTESNAVAGAEHRGETPVTGIGIVLEAYTGKDSTKTADTANIRTGRDTTLNINVTGTGTTASTTGNIFQEGGAAFLSGIYAEGGEIYAQGDVNIDVTAKGGTTIGTMLYARALDHEDLSTLNGKTWEFSDFGKTVSYDHTSTFEKSLTLNVSSDTGRAVGMILAGSCCNLEGINGKWEDENGYIDNRQLNATTKVTVNDLTVNVKKGEANKFASDGILMIGTRVGGATELAVNGNATISADNALRSEYWVNDGVVGEGDVNAKVTVGENASLTLNGNVSGYAGDFIQNGGTVTVNAKDSKFFGGAVQVLGGKLTAENADWTVAANSVLNGDVTLGNVTVNSGNDLQMTGGKLAAKSFSLLGGKIEGNADLTLFGGDADKSILDGATLKVKSLTLDGKNGKGLDDGAFIDVHEGSKLIVTGDMTLTDKTVLSGNTSTVHAQNLFLENGSWYYSQNLNETREFQVSDGVLTLRGGQLITSVDGKETESADKAARIESLLLKKGADAEFSDPVAAYIEAGTYDFKKGVTIADNGSEMRIKGDNTVVNIGALAVNGGSFVIGVDGDKASDKPLVTVKTISIADGAKMELINGTLSTTTDQIFTNGLGVDGTATDAGSQIYAGVQYDKLALTGGTLAFSDAFYNDLYKKSAENTLNDKSKTTLVFNGQRVDAKGSVDIGDIEDNDKTVESNVTVKVDADETGKAEIDKSFGVSRIELSEKVKDILIKAKDAAEKVIKLVGSDKADGELISGESLSTIAVGEKATLQLGEAGSIHNQGQISAALTVGESGTLAVKTGDFKLADVTAGSVTFAANSALVADVTNVTDGTALITADTVSVTEGSKAVLVGTLRQGTTYMLTSDADANLNWADNLVAGNALWKLTMNDDGTISTKLTDASVIFGSSMQGTALANAGMKADNEYVNKLLTDESGNIANLGNTAVRFDAAMNAAGALTTFTTAYDRASDLRQIVREEAVKGEGNRLWARVTGGKTKLKGISTGGADLHTKTNAYGLVIGGEAELSSVTLGAAFTAGTGDTKNSAVSGKDDFDFYGLSVYGTTTLGSVDVLADVSVNVLKSDLTVGGVADVDTDVTTSVYSFGVQGQKTFALDVADISPFIGANIYHVRGGSYSNGHGAHVGSSNATAVEFPIGAKVSKDFETAAGLKVAPAFLLAVVPTVGNRDIDSKVKFAGAQSTYNYTLTDDVKVRTKLGVDATSGNFNFGLHAGYEWGNEERSSASVEARLKYMF